MRHPKAPRPPLRIRPCAAAPAPAAGRDDAGSPRGGTGAAAPETMLGPSSTSSRVRSRLNGEQVCWQRDLAGQLLHECIGVHRRRQHRACMRSRPLAISSVSWPWFHAIRHDLHLQAVRHVDDGPGERDITGGRLSHRARMSGATLITSTGRVRSRPGWWRPRRNRPAKSPAPAAQLVQRSSPVQATR